MGSDEAPKDVPKFIYRTFDKIERGRIRRALLRYETEQDFKSDQKLANKIAETIGRPNTPGAQNVHRRTLRRFLDGYEGTQDEFVNYCDMFLSLLPPPVADDHFAENLLQFLKRDPAESDGALRRLGGVYYSFVNLNADLSAEPIWTPYTTLKLTTTAADYYLEADDYVINPGLDILPRDEWKSLIDPSLRRPGYSATGILVSYNHGYTMLVRRFGHMRTYWLRQLDIGLGESFGLRGTMIDPIVYGIPHRESSPITFVRRKDIDQWIDKIPVQSLTNKENPIKH